MASAKRVRLTAGWVPPVVEREERVDAVELVRIERVEALTSVFSSRSWGLGLKPTMRRERRESAVRSTGETGSKLWVNGGDIANKLGVAGGFISLSVRGGDSVSPRQMGWHRVTFGAGILAVLVRRDWTAACVPTLGG